MRSLMSILKAVIVLAIVAIMAGAAFVYSGAFDVSAGRADGPIVRWLLVTARERSIERRAEAVTAPETIDPALVAAGFALYRDACEACHRAPGLPPSALSRGLDPEPPRFDVHGEHEMTHAQLFWVIRNGIRMTGMPAFGETYSDARIWGLVAVVKDLPRLGPEEYQAKVQAGSVSAATQSSME